MMTTTPKASTPDLGVSKEAAAVQKPRRAFTLPSKLHKGASRSQQENQKDDSLDSLFFHPQVRIVSFRPSLYAANSSHSSQVKSTSAILDAKPGTLPWASRFESTLAYGPLRIYRAPNSVVFLNSGSFINPVMPKTQCWCVDGESKFVLPIRDGLCCRVELPDDTEADRIRVEDFKSLIDTLLRFEKSPCPFKRCFEVELPPESQEPIRYVPWKPRTPTKMPEAARTPSPPIKHVSISSDRTDFQQNYEQQGPAVHSDDSSLTTARESSYLEGVTDMGKGPTNSSGHVQNMKHIFGDHIASHTAFEEDFLSANVSNEVSLTTGSDSQSESDSGEAISRDGLGTIHVRPTQEAEDLKSGMANASMDEPESSDINSTPIQRSYTKESSEADSSDEWMTARSHSNSIDSFHDDTESDATDDTLKSVPLHEYPPDILQTPKRLRTLLARDKATAPPQVYLGASPPSIAPGLSKYPSIASSVESFHSFHSAVSPLPPSPPDSNQGSPAGRTFNSDHLSVERRRQAEVSQVASETERLRLEDLRGQTKAGNDLPEDTVPMNEHQDERTLSNASGLLSKMRRNEHGSYHNPGSSIASPQALMHSRAVSNGRHITASVLQATWAILNSPPSQLVHLMLSVARKIAGGTLRGQFRGHDEQGRPVSIEWDHTEMEQRSMEWDEDDFGVPLRSPSRQRVRRKLDGQMGQRGADI